MNKLETKSLVVKQSTIPNAGNGLFAKRFFKKDSIIGYFKGNIISNEEVNSINDSGHIKRYYLVELDDYKTLDTYDYQSPVIYANDAEWLTKIDGFANNSSIGITKNRSRAYIYATKDIPVGSEIFLEYGEDYWLNL